MIIKFKTFENISTPKIGDWVLITNWWAGQHIHNFIDTTPAQITNISIENENLYKNTRYTVKFDKPFLTHTNILQQNTSIKDLFENGKEFEVNGFYKWKD